MMRNGSDTLIKSLFKLCKAFRKFADAGGYCSQSRADLIVITVVGRGVENLQSDIMVTADGGVCRAFAS
jgi:hypothetical protein